MTPTLREALLQGGATLDGRTGRALHFGEPERELAAARASCVVVDRSDLFRVAGTGPDLLDLLQRLGTGDLRVLEPDRGRPTVLTSPKGRIVQRLFVHHLGEAGLLLVGGPGAAAPLLDHLRRFTFAERTGLADRSADLCHLAVFGPRAPAALEALELGRPERWSSVRATRDGRSVYVLGEDGLTGDGFSIVSEIGAGPSLWRSLAIGVAHAGGCAAGDLALEAWRVLRGVPASGHELTEDTNPLEAGLDEDVSFSKGCYVGQEVVARLKTYDKVSRGLVGLRLPVGTSVPAPGTPLYLDGQPVGRLTSAVVPPGWNAPVALAIVKRRAGEPGAELIVGERAEVVVARVVTLPMDDVPAPP